MAFSLVHCCSENTEQVVDISANNLSGLPLKLDRRIIFRTWPDVCLSPGSVVF